jgi:hypothetical protein
MGDFIQHARLGERKAAPEVMPIERADPACIKAIEGPDFRDRVHSSAFEQILDRVN